MARHTVQARSSWIDDLSPPLTSSHLFHPSSPPAMELFCQKLIDMIISRASLEDIASCSLVARKWRSTSQRRHFRAITLNQRGIVRWYTKIPQDPNGIPSYVQVVVLDAVTHCFEPYTLAGLLPSLLNLRDLFVIDTDLTLLGEPQGGNSVSFDHSYQSVTQLWLICNAFALPTFNSLVLSLPNLTTLSILRPRSIVSGSTPTAPPVPARVLEWFNLSANGASAFTVAFQFRPFKFRNLTLACDRESVLSQFIGNSATTVETLSINSMSFCSQSLPWYRVDIFASRYAPDK